VTLDTASFDDGSQHDDQRRLAFPNHVPEVNARSGQRTLSCNVPGNAKSKNSIEAAVEILNFLPKIKKW
jgi:hypothetical protein